MSNPRSAFSFIFVLAVDKFWAKKICCHIPRTKVFASLGSFISCRTLFYGLPEELIDDEKPKSVVNLHYEDAKSPSPHARARHPHPSVGAGDCGKIRNPRHLPQ